MKPTRESSMMAFLRARREADEDVVRTPHGVVILHPETVQAVNARNYADALLPDRFWDQLRGRESPRVAWKEVRAAWVPILERLGEAPRVAELEQRLCSLIDRRLDARADLGRVIQDVFSLALVPSVIADLSARERKWIEVDQDLKIARLTRPPRRETLPERLRSTIAQIRAGRVARRVLRGRARGLRDRRVDLADPIVDLLPRLGMDRAAYAVTTVLTAIAGPPGAVAVGLLLELSRRPEWARRLEEEHAHLEPERFHERPRSAAPLTHRFVKETLRYWSSPLVLSREARAPLEAGAEAIEVGERYLASPYALHHDSRFWPDPDVFDPDRWLPDSARGPVRSCAYAPFGWAPTSCVGAGLGLVELLLLARLFSRSYRLEPADLEEVEVHLLALPVPRGFHGRITRRS